SSPGSTTSSPATGAANAESGGASHDTRKPKGGKRTTSATKPDKRTADATDDGNPSDPTDTPGGKGGVTQSDAAVHSGDVEDDESAPPTSTPHASKRSRTHTSQSAEAGHSAPATATAGGRHDPDASADTVSRLPSAAIAHSSEPVEVDTTPVQISGVDSSLTATSFVDTPSKPNPPEATSVVTGLFTRFIQAVSPFAASNGPGEPTDSPVAWGLLAFARREFDPAVRTQSVAMTPAVAQQTSLNAPPTLANVLDVVETAVNTIFNTAMRLIEGPPGASPREHRHRGDLDATATVQQRRLHGNRGLVFPCRLKSAGPHLLSAWRIGQLGYVQLHRRYPGRRDQQHRRRAHSAQLLYHRRPLAGWSTDAACRCRPVPRRPQRLDR